MTAPYSKIADSSHWSGRLNVSQARPYIQGIIAKISESDKYADIEWDPTRDQCVATGMPHSGYHFYRCDETPESQVEWFVACMGYPRPMVVWDDVETTAGAILNVEKGASAEVWREAAQNTAYKLSRIQRSAMSVVEREQLSTARLLLSGKVLTDTLKFLRNLSGKLFDAGLYSSPGFIQAWLSGPGSEELAEFMLWIAHVYVNEPTIPAPWAQFGKFGENLMVPLWQYSWIETVPGFPEQAVDMNYLSSVAEPAHEFFGNGEPYEPDDPKLPSYLIVITTAGLNVRTGHGTSYPSVGKLPSQVCLKPFERWQSGNDIWYRVGASRWVAAVYQGQKLCEEIA